MIVSEHLLISVQEDDFNVGQEYALLRNMADNVGAIAVFSGLVREFYEPAVTDAGPASKVLNLFLEHYPGMTEKALQDIVQEADTRWRIQACKVIHRVGELHAGDQIVFVGTASAHRADAFAATEFIMDYLKTRAPFWKRQQSSEGSEWIESRDSDAAAAARWNSDKD